jgi:hypothetical protein
MLFLDEIKKFLGRRIIDNFLSTFEKASQGRPLVMTVSHRKASRRLMIGIVCTQKG